MKLWRNQSWPAPRWVIPPEQSSRFVWKMEQVLEVYKRPHRPKHPVLGFDESPKQLIGEVRQPIKCKNGVVRYDYEYERNGVGNIFLAVEPLQGKRFVQVFNRRTKQQWVNFMKYLAEEVYSDAEKITLVQDNLSTHDPAAFYEYFSAAQAKALVDKFEFIHTPEHGSWLNVAEIELSVLQEQCLNRRIAEMKTLKKQVEAWQQDRNQRKSTIDWQFQDKDARIKLRHLYPTI